MLLVLLGYREDIIMIVRCNYPVEIRLRMQVFGFGYVSVLCEIDSRFKILLTDFGLELLCMLC